MIAGARLRQMMSITRSSGLAGTFDVHRAHVEGSSMPLTFGDAKRVSQTRKTRGGLLLNEMDQVIPWQRPVALMEPHYAISAWRDRLVTLRSTAK